MRIETGTPEDHPTPLPYDGSQSPALARPTAIVPGQLTPADQGGVFDATGDQQDRLGGYEADIRSAQSAGMTAENDRRDGYHRDVLPLGAEYGTSMDLPPVPAAAVPPASSDLYPYSGMEPTPAAAGFQGEYGD